MARDKIYFKATPSNLFPKKGFFFAAAVWNERPEKKKLFWEIIFLLATSLKHFNYNTKKYFLKNSFASSALFFIHLPAPTLQIFFYIFLMLIIGLGAMDLTLIVM